MEEEIARDLKRKAENNTTTPITSTPITMSSKILGSYDAKRMSFDENMPMPQYGTSPLSSILSQSPRTGWTNSSGGTPNMANQGRRDSLKNLWHLQDFGTD